MNRMEEIPVEMIRSIVKAEMYEEEIIRPDFPHHPVVTLSRYFGCNDEAIAVRLAERLGVKVYDKDLLSSIARSSHADPQVIAQIDERPLPMLEEMIYGVFGMNGVYNEDFAHFLALAVTKVCQVGGVIVGRGAHLFLPCGRAFRLRLEGSLTVCAERVARERNLSVRRAKQLIVETNADRIKFTRQVFKNHPHERAYYDMVLNTDLFSTDQAVGLILMAMAAAGYEVPGRRVEQSALSPEQEYAMAS